MKRNEILDEWVKLLKENYEIEPVRRHRSAANGMYVEFISRSPLMQFVKGHQNTLKEAEACGYWVMVRKQLSAKKRFYKNHQVYQLFLTPVHPKKKFVDKVLAAAAMDFSPITKKERRNGVRANGVCLKEEEKTYKCIFK